MGAPTRLASGSRLQTVLAPSPVGGLNSVSPFAAMDPTEAIVMTNLMPSAYGARTRLGSVQWVKNVGSIQATGTFTPPTSGTAAVVIGGNSVNCVFNTNPTTTITNFKATLAGNTAISALVTWAGTTNLVFTAKQPGANGNTITTTTSGGVGASWLAGTLTGGTTINSEIRSVLAYSGTTSANDRLFVACTDGIYDASTTNIAATKVVTFGSTTGLAGYCTSAIFTTVAGNFMVVVDEVNGLYVYTESTGLWNAVTNGAGAWQLADSAGLDATIPGSFTSVSTWQNRLWFTQRSTGRGWFLGTGALPNSGAGVTATAQQFGVNMPRGGELRCLKNWTVDGGAGVENNLVAISSAGDISVYTGTDPTTVGKFSLVGTWSFAGLPSGRRIAIDNGGDVLILTAFGLISLSKLLQGASVADRTIYETKKIDNTISNEVTTNSANLNWAVQLSPDESAVLLSCPQGDGSIVQYAMNYQTRGWCKITGRDAHSMGVWQNHLYFGDGLGSVFKAQGGLDEVGLTGGGTSITFTYFSSFQALGDATRTKRVQLVRPMFLTGGTDTNWASYVRYDYDLTQNVSTPSSNPGASSLWDVATWDSSLWGGDLTRDYALNGVQGMGRVVAIFMIGVCSTTTVLNSIDVLYDVGGLL